MRKLRKNQLQKIAFALAFGAISFNSLAQDEEVEAKELPLDKVVVTGTKFSIPIEKSGKTIYKLTSEDIERNAGKSVADILNEVPGIQVDGSYNNPGSNLSYYLRGGRNQHTLILVDGVPLNDPSAINAFYDLRLLPVNQIESIEVLKGGLSTLYGTSAAAGIINIKLKEGTGEKIQGHVGVNGGSYGTIGTNAGINGKSGALKYSISGNYLKSNGLSAASDENSTTDFNKDGFSQKNALIKLSNSFSDNFSLDFVTGYDAFDSDFDDGAFSDGENQQRSNQVRIGLTPTFKYSKGKIKLSSLINLNDKEFISSFPSHAKGMNLQLDLVHEHQLNDFLKLLSGINYQDLSYKNVDISEFRDNQFSILDPYASLFFENNSGFNLHAGVRLNTHSDYASKLIYNINPSFSFDASNELRVKLLSSVSTSYITPSLYQLYSAYGNLNLSPEESLNIEGGFSLYLREKLELNAVYFKREEKTPIGWDSGIGDFGGYNNLITNRIVDGYEVDLKWSLTSSLQFAINYAHAESDVESSFYRIPKDKFGLNLNYDVSERSSASIKYNYTSSRQVQDFSTWPATVVNLDSFGVLDLYAQHHLIDQLKIFGAVNNLLDEDFVGVLGFTTRGRNFNVGLNYNF
ncbi:MAG: TonB-dependent receptor [Cyclobacteriaceae bacterium]